MTEFVVNRDAKGGCYDVGFTDNRGRKFNYTPNRNGRFTVDNPAHARVIEQSARNDGGFIQKAMVGAPTGTPSKNCLPCRFVAYAWQTACPKCGGDLIEGES